MVASSKIEQRDCLQNQAGVNVKNYVPESATGDKLKERMNSRKEKVSCTICGGTQETEDSPFMELRKCSDIPKDIFRCLNET